MSISSVGAQGRDACRQSLRLGLRINEASWQLLKGATRNLEFLAEEEGFEPPRPFRA